MRKFFSILAVLTALLCLSSCNLDKVQTFTFSFEAVGYIENPDDLDAAKTYFQENFMDASMIASFTCKSSEAMDKALTLFADGVAKADTDYILSLFSTEDDYAELDGVLSSPDTRMLVGYRVWTFDEKENPIE